MDKIIIHAVVAADQHQAWDYYTLPEHIVQWNFASEDWCCPRATNDLKVGGMYSARMEAKDGSFGFDFDGCYEEVIRHERLVYRIADGRAVQVVFSGKGLNTEVTVSFDPENLNPIELQRQGWQAILNNYKRHVELETSRSSSSLR